MPIGTQSTRAYSAAHFVLELDQNEVAGFIRSVEGGGAKAEILTYSMGASAEQWRQLAKPKYEDIKIQVGMSMSQTFYQWIAAFFSGEILRKNGAIVAGDFHYNERARREMKDVLISEVTIPKFDAADRAPCYMGVTLVPEKVLFQPGSQRSLGAMVAAERQKLWTPNHFELIIDGLESATHRTTKIESFSIKQQILEYRRGDKLDAVRVPGRVVFPNLTFYVPEADAGPLIAHFDSRVLHGAPAANPRITGSITAMDSDNDALCTISLTGIDIASIGPDKSDSASQDIKQVRVDITVESMQFKYARGAGQL